MNMHKGLIIAIDGPVAAGKGTIAPELSERLQGFYLYTGATYRCLALYCLEHSIDVTDKEAVIAQLPKVEIDLRDGKVILNGREVTQEIKGIEVARNTPVVAAIPEVRREMVRRQQQIGNIRRSEGQTVLVEGRDIATVVFPDAELKVFLTATPKVRAQRRLEQHRIMGNTTVTFEDVLSDLQKRDKEDTERVIDPLVKDPENHGYFIVDNTGMSESETVDIIIKELQKRNLV